MKFEQVVLHILLTAKQSLSCKLYILYETLASGIQYMTLISHPLTHFSIVVLRLCVEQPADPLYTPELDLHISQVTHHPVQVVWHLEYQVQSYCLKCSITVLSIFYHVLWTAVLPWEHMWGPDPLIQPIAHCKGHCWWTPQLQSAPQMPQCTPDEPR